MAMEKTKRLLKTYQRAAANIRVVADELEARGLESESRPARLKANKYAEFAEDLENALREDGIELDD